MKGVILFAILAAVLFATTTATECPAGYFATGNYERPCGLCNRGDYCPGDDMSHSCNPGTVAPNNGATSCQACESGRSNSFGTLCLLPGIAKNAQELGNGVMRMNVEREYWYVTIDFDSYHGAFDLIQFTFVDKSGQKIPSLIYASTKNPSPSRGHSEFTATGVNATFAFTRDQIGSYTIVYFQAVPVGYHDSPFEVMLFPWLTTEFILTEPHTEIPDSKGLLAKYWENEGRIVYKKDIPAKSRVSLTVTVEDIWTHSDVHFVLYYSTQREITYPNMFNADVSVRSSKAKIASATLVTITQSEGPLFVNLYFDNTAWRSRITFDVEVTPARISQE